MNRPQVVGQPTTSKHFKKGINTIADLLAPTLGPTGGHIASQRDSGQKVELLDDAATIVRRILSLGSAQDDIGAMTMRSLIWRVSQRAGDGGATAAVLARAVYNEGLRLVTAGANAVRLERGVDRAVDIVVDTLYQLARPVQDENMLSAAARTLTKEEDMSAVMGEMSYLLGPDAQVMVEKFVAPYLEREYIAGAYYKSNIASMYFYTDAQRKRAALNGPAVAIIDGKLTAAEQALPLLEGALKLGKKALVIVAADISGPALSLLVANNQAKKEKKKLDILGVKPSVVGDERRWAWTDLAVLTGATVLGPDHGLDPADATPAQLGQAQRVEFANKGFVLVAPKESRGAIQDEVNKLRHYIAETPLDDEDRPKYVNRLSTLTGGVGRLKIGATSKLEREMLYQQAQRSFHVLSAAQRKGVVPGGGAALLHCAAAVRAAIAMNGADSDEIAGMRLIERVLEEPLRQIVHNAHIDTPAVIVDRVLSAGSAATYDATQGKVVDAYETGIVDAADVVATILQTAVSGAIMALTTDAIVYHREPEQSMTP